MKASASLQGGFGEGYLVPVIAAFALCMFLLVPLLKLLFAELSIFPAVGLSIIAILGSVFLSSQCFGDYLNPFVLALVCVAWRVGGSWVSSTVQDLDIGVFTDEGMIPVILLSTYFYLHAIALVIFRKLKEDHESKGEV